MEHDDFDSRIRSDSRRFYEQLEMRCKRFQPNHFAPTAVKMMHDYHKAGKWVWAPPHQIGQMIEANCAYTRCSNNDMLTHNKYAQIHNIFHNYENLALADFIERDYCNFFLLMHREQMELQRSIAKPDLARFFRLFISDSALPKLSAEMKSQYGLIPADWLKASLAIYATTQAHPCGLARISPDESFKNVRLEPDCVKVFLEEASCTPKQIGKRFIRLREETQPKFHPCLRSVFIEHPIIDFGSEEYQVPFPDILLRFGAEGLYRILSKLSNFSNEFGKAVQKYVERISSSIPDIQILLQNYRLERKASGKSCDLLIELPSHILLIESKTSEFSRNIITPETIQDDNSTKKILRAIDQIYKTASDVRNGVFRELGVTPEKPLWGVVTTFGEVPFANASWYFDKYLLLPSRQKQTNELNSEPLSGQPTILSLRYFDLLVTVMRMNATSLPKLYDDRKQQGYGKTGDWDVYLEKLAHGAKREHLLPHIQSDYEAFFEQLGVPRNGS